MGNPPRSGIKPMSPVLAGEVLSTLPPGKFTWHNLDPMVIMYLGNTRHVHSHKLVQEACLLYPCVHRLCCCCCCWVAQSCLTLCNPIDSSPPGSPVPGILQARTLEWVAISFSTVWKWKMKVKSLSRVRLLVTPWTAAYQAPPSMGFSKQEYWNGLPLPSHIDFKYW